MKESNASLVASILVTLIISNAQAATINWTAPSSGGWNTATNWSSGTVPGSGDTAVIAVPGVTVSLNGPVTVGELVLGTSETEGTNGGAARLELAGQNLSFDGALTVYGNGDFTIDSGTLTGGTTNAVLSGVIDWTGGDLAGTLTIASNGTLVIEGAGNNDMPNLTLINNGTVAWTNGTIRGGGPSATTIENYGVWTAENDGVLQAAFGGNNITFNNYGVFRKSEGTTNSGTSLQGNVAFNLLAGELDVQMGHLYLQGGGDLTGGYVTTNEEGTVHLNQNSFTINGTITSSNVVEDGGSLVGTNVVHGALGWEAGLWNGAASVTITTNSTLTINGPGNNDMSSTVMTNNGTVNWISGTIRGGAGGTEIYNGGVWNALSDESITATYGGNGVTFNNSGTFRKTAGGTNNQTTMGGQVTFNQLNGIIDVEQGNLVLDNGGNFSGGYTTTNATGSLYLNQGNFTINGTITSSNVIENGGVLAGVNVVNGGLTWVAGNWNGASSITIAGKSTVYIAGGAGNNDVANTVVTNLGTVQWISGTIRGGGPGATVIYNYGLWAALSDEVINSGYGGNGIIFNNYGTVQKLLGNMTSQTVLEGGVTYNQFTGAVLDIEQGNLVLDGGGDFLGGTITPTASGATYLNTGTYTLNGVNTSTNLIQNGANLVGTNIINGAIVWVAGDWNGANSITVTEGSTLTIAGENGNNDLNDTVLTNNGTVIWMSGTIRGGGTYGTTIYNNGLWLAGSDEVLNAAYGGNGVVFYNTGTFRKTVGLAESGTIMAGNVIFNLEGGVVDVQNGNFLLQGGGTLSGGYITTNTNGITHLNQGYYNLNGTVTPTNVWEDGGILVGTNVIEGALTWLSGNWNGIASMTIASNATLIINGSGGNNDFSTTVITNYGTVDWLSGTIRGGGSSGTIIYNLGVWNAQSDQTINSAYGGPGTTFNNLSIFRKTAGVSSNSTVFGAVFNQLAGSIDVQQGNLVLDSGGVFSAGYTTTNQNAFIFLNSGNMTINGTVTTSNVVENGVNLVGTNVVQGGLTWMAGDWDDVNAMTVTTNSELIMAGGGRNLDMPDVTLTNNGLIYWESGTLRGGGGGAGTTIYNNNLWEMVSDQTFNSAFGGNGAIFNNTGIVRKTAGATTNETFFQLDLNQIQGELDIQQGNLVLQGNANFTGGYITTNPGTTIDLQSGNVNLNGTSSSTNLVEAGALLVGTNVINGGLTWTGGDWDNVDSVTISPNSTVVIAGGGQNNMDMPGAALTNYGTVDWVSGTIRGGGGGHGTAIYNEGIWNAQSDQTINSAFGGTAVFHNAGSFVKTGGTNATTLSLTFISQNASDLEIDSGTVSLAGNTYAQDNGNLTVTLGGNGAGQWGQIATSGNALLSGALNLKFANGFIPPPSGQYVLVSAANLQGTFNPGNLPFGMSLAYSKTNATLIWNGITQSDWGMGNPALHGTASNSFLLQPGVSVQLIATSKGGTTYNLGTTTGSGLASIPFNTAQLPNGIYTLQAVVRNASGQILGDFSRTVFVNNSLSWHDGSIAASQTWGTNAVNAIDQTVIILNGATLTIAPGAVMKFAPGAGIVIETGGTLDASGATAQLPVIFTSLSDNSVGGISDENPNSVPQLGSWAGIIDSGSFKENSNVQVRYALQTVNGVITSSQEWLGATEYLIDGNLIVPTNVTLTIDPGTIVKFSLGVNMTIEAGGALAALGTEAQPITFTSVNDASVGVDTNVVATTPSAGDWDSIYLNGGEATMDHVAISYGGGPDALNSGLISLIGPGSVLNISDSILSQGFYKDINAEYGLVNITNCLVTGTQRGIQSGLAGATTVNVVNCTVDNNSQYSLLGHGGVLNVWNTIVSASQGYAVYYCCGSTFATFAYNDIWSTSGSEYGGIAPQTGLNGNISVNPNYVNAANGNYQLNYGSPAINSADALVAPLTDLTGAPLYNDPRTEPKTGVPNSSGLYADMGAFNFEESATSTIDLIVTNVSGPAQATAGQVVSIQWNDVNQGTGSAVGPWYDTITLVPQNGGQTVPVATVLVAQNKVLGPGQSYAATAQVTVPGDQDGFYLCQVQVNSQGDVFEGANWTNNTTLATSATTLTVTNLSEGIAATNELAAAGDYQWYAFTAPSNGNYTVTLNRPGGTEGLAIYVGQGFVPTAQNFDQMANGGSAGTLSVPINSTSTQPYYVAVYAATGAGAGLFTLSSTTPSPALTSVTPNIVGNAGTATLTITGGDLSALGTYQIVDPAGTTHAASAVSVVNPGTVYAMFNFAGLPLGSYSFQINGGALKLANALTVTNAPAGNLLVNITGPALARPGREFPIIVSYTNAGGADLASPVLYLTSSDGEFRLPGETTWAPAQYQILAINTSGGPVGVLPPGYSGQIEVECQPLSAGYGNCDYEVSLADPATNVNWAGLEQSLRPEGEAADAWGAVYSNFVAKVGTTAGQYQNVLARDATYLGQLGETVASVRRLLTYEFEQADNFGAITKRYHLGAFGRNVPDPMNSTATTDSSGNVIVQCSGLTRLFALRADGSYLGPPGDYAILTKAGGTWQLREVNGVTRAFLPSGALNYIEDNFNRITVNYTGSQVTSLSDSFGNTVAFTYGNGRVTEVVDPVGRGTSYTYDASGQHMTSATGSTGTTNFGWITNQSPATEHALSSITFPDGTHCYYQYDSLGRMTNQSLDGGAEPITYAYDNAGGMTATDATGRSGTVVLNDFLQTSKVQDDDLRFSEFSYDTNRQPLSINATLGADWQFVNDSLGNRLEALDPLGQQTSFTYEPVYQHLTSVTDPLGHAINKTYDANGSVVTETYPDGSSKSFQHDSAGNLIGWTSRSGLTTVLAYNTDNLLTKQSLADGTAQTFTYDAHRNLASFTDATGTTSYTYDGADRLTGVTYPNGHSLEFAYNAAGLRTQLTDQTGFTLNYSYDGLSRLAAVSNGTTLVVQYGYDNADRIVRKTFGNGSRAIHTYAPSGLLQSITNLAANNSVVSSFGYSYDAAGRVTTLTTLAGAFTYAYDADDQITTVTTPGGRTIAYQYDEAGNRISETDGGTNAAYVVNDLNEYQWLGGVNLNYDQDGNLISRIETNGTTTVYAYDSQNHLIGVTNGADNWTYQYNALWQRTGVTANGVTTQYDIDPTGPGSIVAEYSGGLVAHYVYGLDLASRVDASGNTAYYTFDGSGNTANLTDASSATVASYSYLPFGEKLSASSTVANPFTYVGELGVTDEGQGLYLMRNRWYDPSQGHFTQPDPADLDGGTVNLYQYANNNPIHRSDPNGLGLIATIVGLVTGLPANEAVNTANTAVAAGNANRAAQGVDYSDPNADLSGLSGTAGGNISGALQATGHLTMTSAVGSANAGIQSTAGYPGITTPLGATGAAVNYGEGKMMPPPPPDSPFGPGANKFMGPGNSGNDFSLPPGSGSKAWNPPSSGNNNTPGGGGKSPSKGNTAEPHSGDPNNKSSDGFGTQGYVTGAGNILYMIQFANETNAAAPAAEVTVTDQLDPNLDWSTFAFQNIVFNNVSLIVPNGVQAYTAMAQVTTDPNPVKVTASFNATSGLVTWVMESIDPVTKMLPADPLAGFLPPDNTQGQGEGNLTYTVSARAGLPNGTIIRNQAIVVFDANAPIATAITTNTIDTAAPTSSLTPLPASSSPSFTVSWSGKDTGPGIAGYNIFVATNDGVWTLWQEGTTNTSGTFTGTSGNTYTFYSVAYDNAGLVETQPIIPGATTTVGGGTTFAIARATAGDITLTWSQGTLLQSSNLTGPWSTNTAISPYTFGPTNAAKFFKLLLN